MSDYDPIGQPLDDVLNELARQGRHLKVVETRSPIVSQAQGVNRSPRVIAMRAGALVVAWFDMCPPALEHVRNVERLAKARCYYYGWQRTMG